ncbi:MBOAT family O-acyltransferase [Paenibacillus sp. J2TS4]|uniref:MBOAT family O-acyltransferase n=1 Tax=Paenibacillus sp. J2TS4 TaxID=2807194 RepID=UPI001B1AC866|nr:MBOAT family O-acyltransferase [Paenibacillus sp. J2TS4]GIP35642.1 D-alanyl-lipoteichoic acid biosynthesis protein DltB [Paenibacillus sp. J2TS4]
MFYFNIYSIIGLAGMIAVLLLTRHWKDNKRVLLLLFNFGFLLVFNYKLFLFYAAYTAINYAGYRFLCRVTYARLAWFIGFILVNIGIVSLTRFLEYGWFNHPAADLVVAIGLIYNVLKVIDAYYFAYFFRKDGQAAALDYANFILFIPTFTSGPILRFRDFIADSKKPYSVDSAQIEANVKRIILGLFKAVVLSFYMRTAFDYIAGQELMVYHSIFLLFWFYLLIYVDFSGYSDIAIGFGRLLGYQIPENFKKPFLSPSMTQFWRNWHASLGDWFREHIFMFFSRKAISKTTGASLSLLIMVLIGLWHGYTWPYLLYGLYHGCLIALENLFGFSLVNKKKVSKPYYYFRIIWTQTLVAFSVIVYSGNIEIAMKIYRGLLSFPSF